MAIPRNLANFANQLNTSGESPKIQVGDSKVEVTDTGSNGTIVFNTDGSERMKVTSAGNVEITGNLVVADGKGIDFSATPGTGTSELFDDYEEGTWTPVIGGAGGESGQTYAASGQLGVYTKIGRFVTVTFRVELSNKGTITGTVVIKGLPFTVGNGGNNIGSGLTSFQNLATNWNFVFFQTVTSSTYAEVLGTKTAVATTITATTTDIGNSTQFNGSLTYTV